LELGKANVTFWKNGSQPKNSTLKQIADYFDVSPDYLMGKPMTIGQLIENARINAEMTQEELAKALGKSKRVIIEWEKDLRNLDFETLKRVAEALNVDYLELIPIKDLGEDEATPTKGRTTSVKPIEIGDSYFDGQMKVAGIDTTDDGKMAVTFDIDDSGLTADELMELFATFKRMSARHGWSVSGMAQLAEAAVNAISEAADQTKKVPEPHKPEQE